MLATRLERDLTDQLGSQRAAKEEILYRYLNTVYFGDGAYGAARRPSRTSARTSRTSTLSEAAMLVAIIPSPTRYAPRVNLLAADERRIEVLRQMRDLPSKEGTRSATTATPGSTGGRRAEGRRRPVQGHDPGAVRGGVGPAPVVGRLRLARPTDHHLLAAADNGPPQFPYFVDYVRQYLLEKYGPGQGVPRRPEHPDHDRSPTAGAGRGSR